MAITGIWISPIQYRMTDVRTRVVRMLFLPQAADLEAAEIEDMVEGGKEKFLEYLKGKADHQIMPRTQQHEFGPHLRAIEESKRRFKDVGHGRYW